MSSRASAATTSISPTVGRRSRCSKPSAAATTRSTPRSASRWSRGPRSRSVHQQLGAVPAQTLTGNEFAQKLIGNAGINTLDGGGGADVLVGLGGDDTYIVDDAGDLVIEAAGGGTDRSWPSVSYALTAGASVEMLSSSTMSATGFGDQT